MVKLGNDDGTTQMIAIRTVARVTEFLGEEMQINAGRRPEPTITVAASFKLYGLSRTARFAGSLVQLQYLPENCLPDIDEARALIRPHNFKAL